MNFRDHPRNIAIVVQDPKVGAYVYQAVIDQVNALAVKNHKILHPDVVVYARKARHEPPQKQFEFDSEIARKLNSDVVFYPDTSISGIDLNLLKRPVYKGNQPLVQGIKSAGVSSVVDVTALPKECEQQVNAWAKQIIEAAFAKDLSDISHPPKNSRRAPDISHPEGLIAVHGGMGPESGNGALMYLSEKFNGDILLYSAARTPNSAKDYITQTHEQGYSMIGNPLPHVVGDRKKIASVHPDVVWMSCNTMHYFQDPLEKLTDETTLHIIEEGLRKVPQNAAVLLLATRASVASGIFKKALEHLGRKDIRLIYPEPDMQRKVDQVVEDHVLKGFDYPKAADMLEEVVQHYAPKLANGGCVMAGCTEVQVALKQGYGKLWDFKRHKKEIFSHNLKRFFSTKPDLIVMNLSQNPARVFTDYELPALKEFCVVDNLKEAADKSVELCSANVARRRAGIGVKDMEAASVNHR